MMFLSGAIVSGIIQSKHEPNWGNNDHEAFGISIQCNLLSNERQWRVKMWVIASLFFNNTVVHVTVDILKNFIATHELVNKKHY